MLRVNILRPFHTYDKYRRLFESHTGIVSLDDQVIFNRCGKVFIFFSLAPPRLRTFLQNVVQKIINDASWVDVQVDTENKEMKLDIRKLETVSLFKLNEIPLNDQLIEKYLGSFVKKESLNSVQLSEEHKLICYVLYQLDQLI